MTPRRFSSHRRAIAVTIAACTVVIGAATVVGRSQPPRPPDPVPLAAGSPLPEPPGTTQRVSVGDDEGQGDGPSGGASALLTAMNGNQAISADGRWVAFTTAATNLIPNEARAAGGLYVRDRLSGDTVSIPWVDGNAFPGGVSAAEPAISGDGGVVAFTVISNGATRGVGLPATTPYVLAWDRLTGLTELVSVDANLRPTPGYQPSISADGFHVAYTQWFVDRTPADTTPPVLSNLATTGFASGGEYFVFGPSAQCTPHEFTISVTATDPDDAVGAVTLFYQPLGGNVLSTPMANANGSTWQVTVPVQDAWAEGQIFYWVEAVDSNGNQSPRLTNSSAYVLKKGGCIL